jgi:hypothetical protein
VRGEGFHFTSEHTNRWDPKSNRKRREREAKRHPHSNSESQPDGLEARVGSGKLLKQAANPGGNQPHQGLSEEYPEKAPRGSQQQTLEEVAAKELPRARAERFPHRDGIEPLR